MPFNWVNSYNKFYAGLAFLGTIEASVLFRCSQVTVLLISPTSKWSHAAFRLCLLRPRSSATNASAGAPTSPLSMFTREPTLGRGPSRACTATEGMHTYTHTYIHTYTHTYLHVLPPKVCTHSKLMYLSYSVCINNVLYH